MSEKTNNVIKEIKEKVQVKAKNNNISPKPMVSLIWTFIFNLVYKYNTIRSINIKAQLNNTEYKNNSKEVSKTYKTPLISPIIGNKNHQTNRSFTS